MREEIFISGFGGQGIVLAGEIIAKAAMLKNFFAVLTKFYGAEVRGGAVSSGVIISNEEILFPFVRKPDFLLALHEKGIREHAPREAKLVIVDKDLVKKVHIKYEKMIKLPIVRIAEKVGSQKVANVVLLGAFTYISKIIDLDDVSKALKELVGTRLYTLNSKALEYGYKLARMEIAESI